jgi:hypothetical protein
MSPELSPFFSQSVCAQSTLRKRHKNPPHVLLGFRVTSYRAPVGIIRLADWSTSSRQSFWRPSCMSKLVAEYPVLVLSGLRALFTWEVVLFHWPQGLTGVKDPSAPAQASGPEENAFVAAGKGRLFTALSVCPLREKRQRTIPLLVGERQQESNTGRDTSCRLRLCWLRMKHPPRRSSHSSDAILTRFSTMSTGQQQGSCVVVSWVCMYG